MVLGGNLFIPCVKHNRKTLYETRLFLLDAMSKEAVSLEIELPVGTKLFPSSCSSDGSQLFLAAVDYPNYTFHFLDIETGKVNDIPFEPQPVRGADWFAGTTNQP